MIKDTRDHMVAVMLGMARTICAFCGGRGHTYDICPNKEKVKCRAGTCPAMRTLYNQAMRESLRVQQVEFEDEEVDTLPGYG